MALLETGNPAEAIPHLEWAVAKSPTDANRLALAQAYRKNKQPDKEIPFCSRRWPRIPAIWTCAWPLAASFSISANSPRRRPNSSASCRPSRIASRPGATSRPR